MITARRTQLVEAGVAAGQEEPTLLDGGAVDEVRPHEGEGIELKRLKRTIRWKRAAFGVGGAVLLATQIATVVIAVFAAIPFMLSTFLGYSFSVVLTGSMAGTVEVGDVVVTQQYLGQELTEGQVVGIESPAGRFLHRIVTVNDDGTYVTQGDANNTPDLFKPTGDDFWGIPIAYFHQPMATYLTAFALDTTWLDSFWQALSAWKLDVAIGLLPSAPWGWLALMAAIFIFWWLIPDFISFLRNRAEAKDELALEKLKLAVAKHDESITEHDESIAEVVPVVEELRHEHEAAKAEKEAELAFQVHAQEQALNAIDSFDLDALYDEPGEPTPEETEPSAEVELPDLRTEPTRAVASAAHAKPSAEEVLFSTLAGRRGTRGAVTGGALHDELPPLDSTPMARSQQPRSTQSAFYLEDE
jgi:signal peptidase I